MPSAPLSMFGRPLVQLTYRHLQCDAISRSCASVVSRDPPIHAALSVSACPPRGFKIEWPLKFQEVDDDNHSGVR